MSYVNNHGTQIYFEVEGQGSPIILAHGLTGDTTFWRGYGYVDQLKDLFTVILFDARGHGQSDKPSEVAAYDYQIMGSDVLAILDALNINRANYWGYSMGGFIGLGLAKHYPERLISLISGGADPYYSATENEEPTPLLQIFRRGIKEGADAVVDGMRSLFGSITPPYEARLRGLDPQAMAAYLENAPHNRPNFGDAILHMKMPCLLYAGEHDEGCYENSKLAAHQMLNARFFSLPNLDHVGASSAIELIMPQVQSFLLSLKG
jgi:pimeloyl-ACP methyl ester carboxylesterase